MKNKRMSKFNKGGLYIALCCFALIAAVIGYAGSKDRKTQENEPLKIDTDQIAAIKTPESANSLKGKVTVEVKDEPVVPKVTDNEPVAVDAQANEEDIAVSNTVELDELKFISPVKGKTAAKFSGDTLIYNELLSDWRTHNGIDIVCDKNAAIYASADGIVSEVYESAQGKSVKIDHRNGYVTVYANLSDQIEVISGDELKAGDIIGKVGSSSVSDFTKEPHLHFEILLNNAYVNPEEYIN